MTIGHHRVEVRRADQAPAVAELTLEPGEVRKLTPPGALDEADLDEPAGLGSGTGDIFFFNPGPASSVSEPAPTQGPVNWDGDSDLENQHAFADVNCAEFPTACGEMIEVLQGHTDWGPRRGSPRSATPSSAHPSISTGWDRSIATPRSS